MAMSLIKAPLRWVQQSPIRTFVVVPAVVLAWELFINKGRLHVQPLFLILMIWGYLQYHLCGGFRKTRGGGGPGLQRPPDQLVTTGIYAYTRNPMYLGHNIFLLGLALSLQSWLAAIIVVANAIWFHYRVLGDEKRLVEQFGQPYIDYRARVKRWIPGLF